MALGLGAILGAVGGLTGLLQQQSAQRGQARAMKGITDASNAAAEKERAIAAQIMALYNQRMGIANNAINSGTYDPERMVGRLNQDYLRNQERTLGNMAGAFRTMGYRPGDSEPGARLQASQSQLQYRRDQMAEDLRRNAPLQQIGLLGSAEGGMLNRVAGLEGAAANRLVGLNQTLYNQSQPQDISGLLAAVMPFLNQQQQVQSQGVPDMGKRGSTGVYSNLAANKRLGYPDVLRRQQSFQYA